ncbi:MAG: GGDEF domain-containing protein [Planctomycetota bacterium]
MPPNPVDSQSTPPAQSAPDYDTASLPSQALAAARLCYDAVALGPPPGVDRPWWFNQAFLALAERMSTPPETLARELGFGKPTEDRDVRELLDRTRTARNAAGAVSIVVRAEAVAGPAPPTDRRDPLTGLPDRNWLLKELTRRLSHDAEPFALLFVDLDGFKSVNDRLGHLAGDEALREVARRLQHALREGDTVSRFGGDEFIVLVGGVVHADAIPPLIARLRESVAAPFSAMGETRLSISVGAALSSEGHPTPEALLHAADGRMYANKLP